MATSKDYSRSVIAASDELKDIYCEPCADDGKQIEAEGYCVDCSEYLCGQCYKHHTRYKAFKHHVLQDKANMPLDVTKSGGARDVCVEKCSLHTTKTVEYFCRSCDTLGCNACITVNHRQCENVDHIPDIVKNLDTSEEFKEFSNNLEKKLEAVKKRKKKLVSSTCETDEMKKMAKEELKRQRHEINKFFDHLEAEMDRKIEDTDKNNKKTLKVATSMCDSIHDDLKQIKSSTESKLKSKQNCELFITMKKSKQSIEKVDTDFEKLREESRIQRYALTLSPKIKSVIKNTSEICRFRTANFVSETNVSTSYDNAEVSIFGMTAVRSHFLAIIDSGNNSVKVIDTNNMKVQYEMDLKCEHVWSITNVNDDQVAVLLTSGREDKIQILALSVSGSISKGGQIKVDGLPRGGLAFNNGKFLVVCYEKVEVIDMQGKTLNTINTEYSEGIAVCPNQEVIYLTNPIEHTVTSMTLNGKVTAVYKDEDLKSPGSITVDNEGLVYVRGAGNIHQLSTDCIKIQVLLEDVYGTYITFSSNENRIYANCGNSIQVFQMEK
ncbi:uncharacterized protein LOC123553296 [Mercenaria mercenaria]|uniref:uncharacterized protein LOC123553296 n=1 Tax=Mercenaria mercenaria TaxID=6596 RepID=UPI00234EB998|nr:uncharacterized protein LOC123553296 [Mercenaria mercenaria]